jgi:MFS transporter, DHA1 family, multidrug resistance protein
MTSVAGLSRPTADGVGIDRAQRAAIARLCAAAFLAYCSYAICRTPLLPLFARELGASAPTVGFVVAASTLTGIALKLPAGAWSDVLGRRPLLVAGALVFALLPFTYLGVASLGALIALRFMHGAATAIFGPVASASLSDIAPPGRRGTWLGTYSTIQGAGQVLGPIVSGYLMANGGFDRAFVDAGLIALATPLIVSRWPHDPAHDLAHAHAAHAADAGHTPASSARFDHFRRGVSEVLRERLILITSAAQAAQFVLHGTMSAFLPLFGRDVLGLGISELGWLFGLQTLTTLLTRPLMGAVSDRAGRRGVIVTGLAVCGVAVFLVPFARSFPMLLPIVALYAIGAAVTTSSTGAYITDLARRAQYGAAHGVFGTIYDIGDALGPIAAGLLVASVGYAWMFQTMACVTLSAAVIFHAQSRPQSRG